MSVADHLRKGERRVADLIDDVSVVFTDIVGFTQLSSQIAASEQVKVLNRVFYRFEKLAGTHAFEQLKIKGDAYLFWEDLHQRVIGRHHRRSRSPLQSLEGDLRFWVFLPAHPIAVLLWLTEVIYLLKPTFANKKSGTARRASRAVGEKDAAIGAIQHTSSED
ncbi:MAG: hypothetical protein OER43_06665 [Gammaproteobacteria bacterium]|nr:hypothetical protein [Gammaproteobacteria bacterium]MDH3411299.1 hypothetical protein [Gammaproteobacteria bacterium]